MRTDPSRHSKRKPTCETDTNRQTLGDSLVQGHAGKKIHQKRKGSPYSITGHRVPELIPVFGSQPAGDVSHKPDGRLPLLSPRPAGMPSSSVGCRVAQLVKCLVTSGYPDGLSSGGPGSNPGEDENF